MTFAIGNTDTYKSIWHEDREIMIGHLKIMLVPRRMWRWQCGRFWLGGIRQSSITCQTNYFYLSLGALWLQWWIN